MRACWRKRMVCAPISLRPILMRAGGLLWRKALRILNKSRQQPRKRVAGKIHPLTGGAARDDKIYRLAVDQQSDQKGDLRIGIALFFIRSHAKVYDLIAIFGHRFFGVFMKQVVFFRLRCSLYDADFHFSLRKLKILPLPIAPSSRSNGFRAAAMKPESLRGEIL